MSTKVKKCKICGCTDVSQFAPRKSVICKNCDKPSTNVVPEQTVHESVLEIKIDENSRVLEDNSNKEDNSNIEDNSSGLKELVNNLEETVKKLQEDIQKLNKIKKLFPRIFPEDNENKQ